MLIKFNDIHEFLHELRTDYGSRQHRGGILRLTHVRRADADGICHLSVVATITSRSEPGAIIRLERPCGELWGLNSPDDKTRGRADEAASMIRNHCAELGIEVRAGMLEDR